MFPTRALEVRGTVIGSPSSTKSYAVQLAQKGIMQLDWSVQSQEREGTSDSRATSYWAVN